MEANTTTLNLDTLSPNELEARRREIITLLQGMPKGYDDPDVPDSILHELAVITGALRRRTAGPPKATKKAGRPTGPKPTVSDLNF